MRDRDALHDVLRSWGERAGRDGQVARRAAAQPLQGALRHAAQRARLGHGEPRASVDRADPLPRVAADGRGLRAARLGVRRAQPLARLDVRRARARPLRDEARLLGRLANSPFAVGVKFDEPRFYKKKNEQHFKNACDVAYYNVLSWLTELETGKPYKREEDRPFEYGSSVARLAAQGFLNAAGGGRRRKGAAARTSRRSRRCSTRSSSRPPPRRRPTPKARKVAAAGAEAAKLPRFRLRLLGRWGELVRKPRHQKQYSLVTFGAHFAHLCADARVNQLLAPPRARQERQVPRRGPRPGWSLRGACCSSARCSAGRAPALPPARSRSAARDGTGTRAGSFSYDAETAPALAAEVKRQNGRKARRRERRGRAARIPRLGGRRRDRRRRGCRRRRPGEGIEPRRRAPARRACRHVSSLAVGGDQPASGGGARPAAAAAAPVAATAKPADAAIGKSDKVCVITGLPAKYKDPQTGLPYTNLDVQGCANGPRPPGGGRAAKGRRGRGRRGRRRPHQAARGVPGSIVTRRARAYRINKVAEAQVTKPWGRGRSTKQAGFACAQGYAARTSAVGRRPGFGRRLHMEAAPMDARASAQPCGRLSSRVRRVATTPSGRKILVHGLWPGGRGSRYMIKQSATAPTAWCAARPTTRRARRSRSRRSTRPSSTSRHWRRWQIKILLHFTLRT